MFLFQFVEESKSKSWLLRLFESKMFDSHLAISYMFNSKEPGLNLILQILQSFVV